MKNNTELSPQEVAILAATDGWSPLQMRRLSVMIRAMIANVWPVDLEETKTLKLERFNEVCDELEEKFSLSLYPGWGLKMIAAKTFRVAVLHNGEIVERHAVGTDFLATVGGLGFDVDQACDVRSHEHYGMPLILGLSGPITEADGALLYWSDELHDHLVKSFVHDMDEDDYCAAAIQAARTPALARAA